MRKIVPIKMALLETSKPFLCSYCSDFSVSFTLLFLLVPFINHIFFSVPQDYKLNPGAVESIFEQPEHPNNILVGYNRGLIVLWNRVDNTAVKTFISNQQLESLCWKDDGKFFISSHNDGK